MLYWIGLQSKILDIEAGARAIFGAILRDVAEDNFWKCLWILQDTEALESALMQHMDDISEQLYNPEHPTLYLHTSIFHIVWPSLIQDAAGHTPLSFACFKNKLGSILLLIRLGASLEVEYSNSHYHYLIDHNQIEVFDL